MTSTPMGLCQRLLRISASCDHQDTCAQRADCQYSGIHFAFPPCLPLVSFTEKKEGAIPSAFQERPWKSPVRNTEDNAPIRRILLFVALTSELSRFLLSQTKRRTLSCLLVVYHISDVGVIPNTEIRNSQFGAASAKDRAIPVLYFTTCSGAAESDMDF